MKKIFATLALCLLSACTSAPGKHYSYKTTKGQIYKKVDGVNLDGDLYLPDYTGKKPTVLVIHGGGWDSKAGIWSGSVRI